MSSRTLLCLALGLVSVPVVADTVWLKNGDRLTGTIKLFDGGKLLLQTDYGGAIAVKLDKIATLQSDQQLLIKQDDLVGEVAKSLQPAESGKVTLLNGDAPKTVELASIEQILRPKPVVQDLVWSGNVDVSLDYEEAENTTEDYDLDFKTKARHGQWRHIAEGGYNREFKDDTKVTDNWDAEYSLDRFLDEHWFWQGRLEYKRDRVEDVARQRTVGTGPGYQFWDNELGAFSLGSLLNRTDYEYRNGEKENFYSLGMKWDYNRYLIGKSVELFTNGEVGKPLDSVADYSLDAEAGLRYKVTEWASLNLKAEKEMVSGGSDGELDETRYSIGFGVGW
ncbi:MAG: DUF481 domain-containing protein [Pseudomonas sp.]|uniref:DUF481 domain-containing protein n=1 Tax=Pseudomonas sp. TaxID=306 RepID=UPI0033941C3F